MIDMIQAGTFWWYKGVQYRVQAVHPDLLSQDARGQWVPTVTYQIPHEPHRSFARPVTEFAEKFGPKT